MELDNPKNLFLIDGIGATISAIFLGVVMVQLDYVFGMPRNVLMVLAGVAILMALNSFFSYYRVTENQKLVLKRIAIANGLYCIVTLILVMIYFEKLTSLGVGYFIIEIIIIMGLMIWELKITNV